MKKLMMIVLALAMIAVLTLTGYAAGETLTLSDASASAGQTVYLTVRLNESTVGDSMGITYSYDTSLLKAVPDSCTWSQKSVLQDFDNKNSGVWAVAQAEELQGDVCVLALRILPEAAFSETEVTCTLIVKKGTEKVGEFEATAKVSLSCDHDFGDWADQGNLGHSRTCSLCKTAQTQSHSWDSGKVSTNPDDPNSNLKTYTCTLCPATKTVQVPANNEEDNPAVPPITEPPETIPQGPTAPPATQPSYENPTIPTDPAATDKNQNTGGSGGQQGSSGNQSNSESEPYRDYNQGDITGDDDHDHDQDYGDGVPENADGNSLNTKESYPIAVPAGDRAENDATEHTHTNELHAESVSNGERALKALGIVAMVAILVGVAVYFVKKKH